MKKKILITLLIISALGMTACGSKENDIIADYQNINVSTENNEADTTDEDAASENKNNNTNI